MNPLPTGHHGPTEYTLRVHGRLGAGWSAWFDGFAVLGADDGTTTLHGTVADQAALHGLLGKLRDLGLPILSVTRGTPGPDDRSAAPHTTPPAPERH